MRYEIEGEYTIGYDDNNVERERFITSVQIEVSIPLSPLEFLDKFTAIEYNAIEQAALVNVDVKFIWAKWNKAQCIDRRDPRTISGVNALEAMGLIEPGRADIILNS